MLTAKVTLFGRATTADDFAELWSETAEVGTGTVSIRPNVPAAAAGWELELSVLPSGGSVNFATFVVVTPEASSDDSKPTPRFERASKVYAARTGQERRAPFVGSLVAVCQVGTPQPSAGQS